MQVITAKQVHSTLNFQKLIPHLHKTFAGEFTMPQRQVFELEKSTHNAFAVLPAWNDNAIAVKAFTYFPQPEPNYQSLYSEILLFDRKHGVPKALVNGTSVTLWRTAAVSALASQILSRENSESLLLCGTGNLAPFLVQAHLSVRSLKQIYLWGRNAGKVAKLLNDLSDDFPSVEFKAVDSLPLAASQADIICCATGSPTPLIHGKWIKPGTYIDLLGNHSPDRRECDSEVITKARVFVDSKKNVLNEAGELLIPITEGLFSADMVIGELSELCNKKVQGRENDDDIIVFKSVGTAISDLATALKVYESLSNNL